ncbi:MAG: 23S rRNA (uracil(1939)-C(5))-methyltransferase RlmD [Longicatena sp.]
MKVTIKKIGINGEGIGYLDRTPVFVPGALIDEEVDIRVSDKKKTFAFGELNRVVKQSKSRIQPKCIIQHACGGCPLMIARYPSQMEYKYDLLKQSLIKYAQVNPRRIEKMIPSEEVFGYQNQFKQPVAMSEEGHLTSGIYMPNSNYFFEIKKCWIHEEGLERVRSDIMQVLDQAGFDAYDFHVKTGIRSLIVRGFDDKYQCTIVSGDDVLEDSLVQRLMKIKGVYSLYQSVHTLKKTADIFGPKVTFIAGERFLPIVLDDLHLEISPRSFFLGNSQQALTLYRTIASLVPDNNELIVEAYSGVGAISLYLKDKAKELIGIDTNKEAVLNANKNAVANHAKHLSFICDDAANKLTYLSKKRSIDVLVVDPPRTGLDDEMLDCILKGKIKTIIYVSCNPATLGKNIAILSARYKVDKVIPIDLFPHTAEVESIVKLTRI